MMSRPPRMVGSPMSNEASIVVLSTPTCYRCKTVARHLENKGVEYEYIDVTKDEEWANWMRANGLSNVPQTIKGEERVEGVDFDAINRLF